MHSWVLMPNHFHVIASCIDSNSAGMVFKNIKSFTAIKIIDAILQNKQESRKEWMLQLFEQYGKEKSSNHRYQFWQHENHPILLDNKEIYDQRTNYLHGNPVRAGFVREAKDWLHSSAIDYYSTTEKGLLDLVILE